MAKINVNVMLTHRRILPGMAYTVTDGKKVKQKVATVPGYRVGSYITRGNHTAVVGKFFPLDRVGGYGHARFVEDHLDRALAARHGNVVAD